MPTPPPVPAPRPSAPRLLGLLGILAVMVLAGLLAPAVVAPEQTSTPAYATVYSTCTMTRCADAKTARSGWSAKGFPTSRGWYSWSGGLCNFAGGQYMNYEGQLPSGATYYEYDVYPRTCYASRDAYRIIINKSTGATWFSPDHYGNFYRIA